MNLITEIRNLLLANTAVRTRVGGDGHGSGRIYNGRLPQNVTIPVTIEPSILIKIEDDEPVDALDKQYSIRPTIELKHFALDNGVTEEMEKETRTVLESYQGSLGSTSVRIVRLNAHDDVDPDLDMAFKSSLYRVWL